ncbi:protein scarlet-like [Planococcus citri]|uniref:protein scarlet-like n=1 Tax=Planococcus citri TaxID=170843 RepID=UPI0031F783FB
MLDPVIQQNKNASLVWRNLSVTVHHVENGFLQKKKHISTEIIHNVSGAVETGNLVAILGSSGAGKSTLMGALAHRNQNNVVVEGEITVLGKPIGKFMNEISGFVFQDDLFVPTLTVKEHLMFTAKLKYGLGTCDGTLKGMINDLLSEMGLIRIRDKLIGSSFLEKEEIHLSGGEQKRLSVATELLTNPPLLFCDEPTTGLDSFSALKLVTILRNVAEKHNKTIICSIHQPNPRVFELFHQVILLSRGKIVFMGDNEKDSLSFFKSQGYEYSEDENPAEFLVKCVSPGNPDEIDRLSRNFQESEYFEYIRHHCSNPKLNQVPIRESTRAFLPSWIYSFFLLTYRNFLSNSRDLSVQYLRILQQLLLSIVIGLCMRGAINMNQSGIQAVFGFVFMLVYENSFPAMSGSITLIPKKINIFFREYSNGTNSPLKFLLSSIISLTPGLVVEAILFTLTLYWVVDYQQTFEVVVLTCLVSILLICSSSAFGMFTSILFRTTSVAVIIAVPIFNAFILCAGFYIRLNALPIYAIWVRYVSWLAYATELFFILQWDEVHHIDCPSKLHLPCLRTGSAVLENYNYNVENFWFDIYVLVFMYFLFNAASYICLLLRIRNK